MYKMSPLSSTVPSNVEETCFDAADEDAIVSAIASRSISPLESPVCFSALSSSFGTSTLSFILDALIVKSPDNVASLIFPSLSSSKFITEPASQFAFLLFSVISSPVSVTKLTYNLLTIVALSLLFPSSNKPAFTLVIVPLSSTVVKSFCVLTCTGLVFLPSLL